MNRTKDINGVVHFVNPANPSKCLCGENAFSTVTALFGQDHIPHTETTEQVTCLNCAKVYSSVKNEPCHAVERRALMNGCFEAVNADGPVQGITTVVDTMIQAAQQFSFDGDAESPDGKEAL